MNISPKEFLQLLNEGKTEFELNRSESQEYSHKEAIKLVHHYGHSAQSAREHLTTDYTNGFTICAACGSFYELGAGFTKHISKGCLHCEGEDKHNVYWHRGNNEKNYKTNPRWMAQLFDDGLHYCKDNFQVEKYKNEVSLINS